MTRAKLLTAADWAKEWGVHRNTARARLAAARERYGPEVVIRRASDGALLASRESMDRIKIAEDMVTLRQHQQAIAELWAEVKTLKRAMGLR